MLYFCFSLLLFMILWAKWYSSCLLFGSLITALVGFFGAGNDREGKRLAGSIPLLSQIGHVRSQSTFHCVIAPLQSDSTRKCQSRVFHVNRKAAFCPDGPPHLLGLASAPKTIAGQRELLGRLRLRLLPPAVISYDPGNCCVRQCKPNPGGAQSVLVKKYLYWKE